MATILDMLLAKHATDLCVTECKDGATQTRLHRRLDLWVMLRTWSPITMIGYEIKTSRADFLSDDKYPSYLPLCHKLYIACPPGLIKPEEVAQDVGLIYSSKSGERVIQKKRAPYRDIQLPSHLMVYILMCRAKIEREKLQHDYPTEMKREYWERWLAEKEDNQRLAVKVSSKIRLVVDSVKNENYNLKQENERLENVKKRMIELGFNPDEYFSSWAVIDRLEKLSGEIPSWLVNDLKRAGKEIERLAKLVEKMKEGKVE